MFSTPIWRRCWEVSGHYIAVNFGFLFVAIKEVAWIGFLQLSDVHHMQQTYSWRVEVLLLELKTQYLECLIYLFYSFNYLFIYLCSFLLSLYLCLPSHRCRGYCCTQ